MFKPELLAPAGSKEALHAAVDNGADAVYLGVGAFNARANAENFLAEDLFESISYAHLHSVKVYMTLNTLLSDDELPEVLLMAKNAYDMGVDALIVQDIGLVSVLNEKCPDIPLHASTQMNLSDIDSIHWAKDSNISRVVLPRELSIDEIAARTKEASLNGIEVEVFIHGALCVCYSGLCLFSSLNGNGQRSGNRGLCAQPCRTLFQLRSNIAGEEESGRLLSTKDQSALHFIKDLMNIGVHSLKIEGRMRESSYVAAVVKTYREFIDNIYSQGNQTNDEESLSHLLLAFNRGGSFTTQYMQEEKKSDLLAGNYSGRFGILLGVIVKKNARAGTLSIRPSSASLPVRGDYLSIRVSDQEISSFPIGKIEQMGDILVVMGLHPQMIEKIPDGAKVYQMSEQSYTKDLLSGKPSYKTPVEITISNNLSKKDEISVGIRVLDKIWKGVSETISIPYVTESPYPMLSHDRITEQISKAKSSPYIVQKVTIDPSVELCAPVSYVNELRREAFQALDKKIVEQRHPRYDSQFNQNTSDLLSVPLTQIPSNDSLSNFNNAILKSNILHVNYFDVRRILPQKLAVGADYYSFTVYDLQLADVKDALKVLHEEEPEAKFLVCIPDAYKDVLIPFINKTISYMKEKYSDAYSGVITSKLHDIHRDSWINAYANIYNREAIKMLLKYRPYSVSFSYELKEHTIVDILSALPADSFAFTCLSLHRYGRVKWMQSEFCPVGKHEDSCKKCKDPGRNYSLQILTKEDSEPIKGKDLPVVTHPGFCSSEILGPLHQPTGAELLLYCKDSGISVAHVVQFLDEQYDLRRQIINEIKKEYSDRTVGECYE